MAKHVPHGVAWRAMVADGLPATAISAVADAERADFIVVGTHGRGGLQRLLLGSVAEALIRDAHVPVLTVHSTAVPTGVRRVISGPATADLAASLARDLGAEFIASDAPRDGGESDLIVVGAESKRVRDLMRHARAPVLTVQPVQIGAR